MYKYVNATLLRATPYSGSLEQLAWPDLSANTEAHLEQWRDWIRAVWAHDAFAAAVEVASPVLAHQVSALCDGHTGDARRTRRVTVSLVRYLLRWQHRATPFGLFAGVSPAPVGANLSVRWGEGHHVVAQVDGAWLAEMVARLERSPELLRRLSIMVNNLCSVRGGRVIASCQQPLPSQEGALGSADEVSVRHTKAVEMSLSAARTPLLGRDLVGKLARAYPGTQPETLDGFLRELVARRILISGLRPPMTATDALSHVLDQLAAVHAQEITDLAPTVARLEEISEDLAEHNRSSQTIQRTLRTSAMNRMTRLVNVTPQPIAVNLRNDCSLILPELVAREAEGAVASLARLTRFPSGPLAWQDYHARFLERYGMHALVPLRDLIDPNIGLGFPAGYRGSLLHRPSERLTKRDEQLLALAQTAAVNQTPEIALDGQALAELSSLDAERSHIPAHVTLRFQVHAPTRSALQHGRFSLVVVGVSAAAGTTIGRFIDQLDNEDRHRTTSAYAALPTLDPDAMLAQVSSPPLRARIENVGRVGATLPLLIPLAEFGSSERSLAWGDLAVGADARRMYLLSLSQGRTVEPTQLNAVEPTNFTHPLARFLCEVPRARAASLAPFSWGAASRLPFLPRLRHGRTVISPARWRMGTSEAAPRSAPWALWQHHLNDWRARFHVPRRVYLGAEDQRLRLDLEENAHVELLRSHLEHAGHATLYEAPESSAYGWLDGHAHEITMPFASTQKITVRPVRRHPQHSTSSKEDGHLPGDQTWAFVKLYGHPDGTPDLLTTYFPALLRTWADPPEWWYVRYQDPEPHLRLRFRLSQDIAFGEVAQRVSAWAKNLRHLGLLSRFQWDTYFPETGRYGTGPAMSAAETAFAADSAAAIAQMAPATNGSAHPHALTAASFLNMAITFTGSAEAGLSWLRNNIRRESLSAPARHLHDEAVRLGDPSDGWAAMRSLENGEAVVTAWTRRATALNDYRSHLADDDEYTLNSVLLSLLHMHHIRMNGIDEGTERVCRRFARAAAMACTARAGRRAQ